METIKLKPMICKCGSTEFSRSGDKFICCYCDTPYYRDLENETEEEREERIRRITKFEIADVELRSSPPNFDTAEDRFVELIKEYPEWSAVYWGALRAKYGIKYEIDFDKKCIPSCYKSNYEDFRSDPLFKNALKYAESTELRAKYESEGKRIAETCTEWREKAKKYDYDVFISFKATDENKNDTDDLREMQNLYTYLTEKGYKVFFSPVSMRSVAGKEHYDAYIFNALEKARAMIVYGSRSDYFSTTWVQNEWTRYLRMIDKGLKKRDSLFVCYEKFDPYELPRRLREIQLLEADKKTFYLTVTERLEEVFSSKSSPIKHIKIEGGKIGKKATRITDSVQAVEVGANPFQKREHIANAIVSKKNIVSSDGTYTPTLSDTFQTAVNCLKLGSFSEAEMFFKKCISKNKQNGLAWLGLICVSLKEKELFERLTDKNSTVISQKDVMERDRFEFLSDKDAATAVKRSAVLMLQNYLKQFESAVEYVQDKDIAENILNYIFDAMKYAVKEKLTGAGTDKLFSFTVRYDSGIYEDILSFFEDNISSMVSICSKEEYRSVCKELTSRITETDRYISICEKIIAGYCADRDLEQARLWNNKILEVDEVNVQAILRNAYFSVGLFNSDEFKSKKQTGFSADKTVIPYLKKSIMKMQKEDAEALLAFIGEVEYYCLNNGYFSNAELYFDFIVKYNFEARGELLNKHMDSVKLLADNDRISFFEKYLSAMGEEAVDWHIEKRLLFANELRYSRKFKTATDIYKSIFALEENNTEALNGIFACRLEYDGIEGTLVNWKSFNTGSFEKILSSCADTEEQTDLLEQYVSACISTVKNRDGKYGDCCKVFDQIIKYFPGEAQTKVFAYIDETAEALLSNAAFGLAKKYANFSIKNEPANNTRARYVLLLAALKCKNEEELLLCKKFNKNNNEYRMLLHACGNNEAELQRYVSLPEKKQAVMEQIRQKKQRELDAKRREEERIAEEKRLEEEAKLDRILRKKEEKAERRREKRRENRSYGRIDLLSTTITLAITLLNDGLVVWANSENHLDKYLSEYYIFTMIYLVMLLVTNILTALTVCKTVFLLFGIDIDILHIIEFLELPTLLAYIFTTAYAVIAILIIEFLLNYLYIILDILGFFVLGIIGLIIEKVISFFRSNEN